MSNLECLILGILATIVITTITIVYGVCNSNRHKRLEAENKKQELILEKEKLRAQDKKNEIQKLQTAGINSAAINDIELSENTILELAKSYKKEKHHIVNKKYTDQETTIDETPVSDSEKNYFGWQAKELLAYRKSYINSKTLIKEDDIIIILVFRSRTIAYRDRVRILQSAYNK